MNDEIIFVVDENNIPQDPLPRTKVIKKNIWRRSAGALIIDRSKKKILCHQRSKAKDERPGLWVCTFGGKCLAYERPIDAAARELNEELGVDIFTINMNYIECYKSELRKQFEYVYVALVDCSVLKYRSDNEEVSCLKWVSLGKAKENILLHSNWYSYGYEVSIIENHR